MSAAHCVSGRMEGARFHAGREGVPGPADKAAQLRGCGGTRKRAECGLRCGFMRRTRSANQLIDPVGDALGGVAQLRHGPIGGVALGDVLGGGMVDRPLGQAGRQHELAVGDGDEAVAQRMEPELRPARLSDARIEMLDGFEVAGRAGLGQKHPALCLSRE